ncbi:MAG: DctP family TRAP transporter solute-binding subunit [Oscillospiraceae bacterium]|nr:DctP family TRAP transporter solute-binding subunit [Oscillospiraceae bacterium]
MKMKKVLALVLAVVMLVPLLVGCGGSNNGNNGGSDKPIELRFANTQAQTGNWAIASETFKKEIEEKSNGRYIISVYYSDQLSGGDLVKGWEQVMSGEVDLDFRSIMNATSFEPRLLVMTMPWLFTSYDDVDRIIFNGEGGKAMAELLEAKGAHVLAFGENGFRQLTNNKRPVHTPEDMKNLKIRIPPNNLYISLFKKLGADPVNMSFSEVYTALQQNTVDGEENPWGTIKSANIQEVQKYCTVWNYSYDATALSINKKLWDKLSDADKAMFEEAAKKACQAEIDLSRASDADIRAEFEAGGMQINDLTADEIKAFQEICKPLYEEFREQIGDDLYAAFGYNG